LRSPLGPTSLRRHTTQFSRTEQARELAWRAAHLYAPAEERIRFSATPRGICWHGRRLVRGAPVERLGDARASLADSPPPPTRGALSRAPSRTCQPSLSTLFGESSAGVLRRADREGHGARGRSTEVADCSAGSREAHPIRAPHGCQREWWRARVRSGNGWDEAGELKRSCSSRGRARFGGSARGRWFRVALPSGLPWEPAARIVKRPRDAPRSRVHLERAEVARSRSRSVAPGAIAIARSGRIAGLSG
jgi:hypothetical protein